MYTVYLVFPENNQDIDWWEFNSRDEADEFVRRAKTDVFRADLFEYRISGRPTTDVDSAIRSLNIVVNG
jgi:hypothetical protein